MNRVIQSIRFDKQSLEPDFLEKVGPGLLVILDIEQGPSPLVEPGTWIRIHRPDGTFIDRKVGAYEVFGAKVGLYIRNTEEHEIPRLSEIELLA